MSKAKGTKKKASVFCNWPTITWLLAIRFSKQMVLPPQLELNALDLNHFGLVLFLNIFRDGFYTTDAFFHLPFVECSCQLSIFLNPLLLVLICYYLDWSLHVQQCVFLIDENVVLFLPHFPIRNKCSFLYYAPINI